MAKQTAAILARKHRKTAIATLLEACGPGYPVNARIAAANSLLNRSDGQPTQLVNMASQVAKMSDAELIAILATIPGVKIEQPADLPALPAKK